MLEALILWQISSARAAEKSRIRHSTNEDGEGFVVFMMGLCFFLTILLWPLALGYRTQLLRNRPAIGWSIIPPLAIFLLIADSTFYFLVGFVWALGELVAFMFRNDGLIN